MSESRCTSYRIHAHVSVAPIDITQNTSQDVREDTAELASWALSDIVSNRNAQSPSRSRASSSQQNGEAHPSEDNSHRTLNESTYPEAILEVSEPPTPHNETMSLHTHSPSTLTELIRQPPSDEHSSNDTEDEEAFTTSGVQPVVVREGIISQPSERTSLLLKKVNYGSGGILTEGSVQDLENQKSLWATCGKRVKGFFYQSKRQAISAVMTLDSPKSWDKKQIFHQVIKQPASYLAPVVLGLLLNVLDALSYGKVVVCVFWISKSLNLLPRNDLVSFGGANVRRSWA